MKINCDFIGNDHRHHLHLKSDAILPEVFHVFTRNEPETKFSHTNLDLFHVIWICVKGTGGLMISNKFYELNEGEVIFTFPGEPHIRFPLKEKQVEWLLIPVSLPPKPWLNHLRLQIMKLNPEAYRCLTDFLKSYRKTTTSDGKRHIPEAALKLGLFLHALRMLPQEKQALFPAADTSQIQEMFNRFSNLGGKRKTFSKTASELGVSPGHLRFKIKQSIGKTPVQLKQEMRFVRAQHLLTHSVMNITQIAEQSGFASVYSFSRFFKKMSGISPNTYRKTYQ